MSDEDSNCVIQMQKVAHTSKIGDISIKGTAKEHRIKPQRQRFARRDAEAAIAVAEIEAARSQDCRQSPLLALYWTLSSDGHLSESEL